MLPSQIIRKLRTSCTLFTFHKQRPYPKLQLKIFHRSFALRTSAPCIKTTPRHLKYPAHFLHTPQSAVLGYEREYRFGSIEKMATAFFKMSRSRFKRSFPLCSSRRNASCGLIGFFSGSHSVHCHFVLLCKEYWCWAPFLIIIILQGPNKGKHQIKYYGWYSNKKRGMTEKTKKPVAAALPGMPECSYFSI
jgi:hypothetical protein